MALDIIANETGVLDKFQYDENDDEIIKENIQKGKDAGVIIPKEEFLGTGTSEKLATNAVDLAKENEELKIQLGDALQTTLPTNENQNKIKEKSSLSSFASTIGNSFMEIASVIPKKIDEIASDPDKRKNFMRGLEIINESSGIKPIGQAKSPLGMIGSGLLKAEKGFIAVDLAKFKALHSKKQRSYMSGKEKALSNTYEKYADDFEAARKNYASIDIRFNEIYKLAKKGQTPPTGLIESTFAPLQKIITELNLDDKAEALLKSVGSNKDGKMTAEERVAFKEIFSAATKRQIVGQVKELYPVSNKDIELLLQTVGDISTSPMALRALVSSEKAAKEISTIAFGKSYDIAFAGEGNSNFRAESQDAAALELANKYKDGVRNETLVELFGSSDKPTPFQIVTAFYHQELQTNYKEQEEAGGFFEMFKIREEEADKTLEKAITDAQNEAAKGDLPVPPE